MAAKRRVTPRVRYAQHTTVPIEDSIHAIEYQVARFGGTRFVHRPNVRGQAAVEFEIEGQRIRIYIPLPKPDSPLYQYTPTGRDRDRHAATRQLEQDRRQVYRDILLATTYNLEAYGARISGGVVSRHEAVRDEFMNDLVLGESVEGEEAPTAGELMREMIEGRAIPRPPAVRELPYVDASS